MIPNVTINLIN